MMYLFTTPSCPYCPQAKKHLELNAFKYEAIDASKPVGLAMARRFQVQQVPSLLVTNADGDKVDLYSGIEPLVKYLSTL